METNNSYAKTHYQNSGKKGETNIIKKYNIYLTEFHTII